MGKLLEFQGFESITPAERSFLLMCVAVAYPAWDVGFDYGVYGQLMYHKLLLVWSLATALLLAMLAIPGIRRTLPPRAWLAVAFPSSWIVLVLIARAAPEDLFLRYLLFFSGVVTYAICLPYVLYMAVAIAYPELLKAPRRLPRLVMGCFLLFALAGFFAGRHHSWIVNCEDFELAGQHVPVDCRPHR
ncbi:MAG: hypothetical protein AAGH19_02045 [Pseudomonadota bacterium]